MTVVTVGIFFGRGRRQASATASFTFVAFMAQFSAAAAYNITYAPYVSDYSRYLPRETTQPLDHRLACSSARPGSAIWLIALGAWLAVGSAPTTASSG